MRSFTVRMSPRWQRRFVLACPLLVSLAGWAQASDCIPPSKNMARVELYFGTAGVTARGFAQFLAREVTPRFPDGLSLFEGRGQWRDRAGRVSKEGSRLLLIYYQRDAVADAKIEAIRAAYKRRFHQQSVLRADSSACVSF